ncbi:hypothetical protein BBG47_19950 [Paenibacillus sp. KS1]|uniref:hypothetical protein n=1 Tax=Paenibacillus sp. KS1 TaxID=1849249 RepID=UPI00080658B3|nr:hypothetical protein [Paenibacillus sp. KS1]OBY77765.1 hypothetical protein BBG47_19950 [Paenibacillus sp. KS1]
MISDTESYEHPREVMVKIADELETLHGEVTALIEVYHNAAESSDLTFIKILEEKYEQMQGEIAELAVVVDQVQQMIENPTGDPVLVQLNKEDAAYGR